MNRIITTDNGGFPLVLDDYRFGVEEIGVCMNAFASMGLSSNFVLNGCQITDNGSSFSITEGYCYLNGEIRRVKAKTITKDINARIAIQELNQTPPLVAATKEFKDQSVHVVYQERVAEPVAIPLANPTTGTIVILGYNALSGTWTYFDAGFRRALRNASITAFTSLSNLGTIYAANGFTAGARTPRARFTPLGLELTGDLVFVNPSTATTPVLIFDFNLGLFFKPNNSLVITERYNHQLMSAAGGFYPCAVKSSNIGLTLAADRINVGAGTYTISLDGIIIDV
jgi:hypothetical protein